MSKNPCSQSWTALFDPMQYSRPTHPFSMSTRSPPQAAVRPACMHFIIAKLAKAPPGSVSIDDRKILERLLFPVINEGALILKERIALRASDVDLVWVMGYRWQAYRGGPLFYADTVVA